jgi:hypothetical protein
VSNDKTIVRLWQAESRVMSFINRAGARQFNHIDEQPHFILEVEEPGGGAKTIGAFHDRSEARLEARKAAIRVNGEMIDEVDG